MPQRIVNTGCGSLGLFITARIAIDLDPGIRQIVTIVTVDSLSTP